MTGVAPTGDSVSRCFAFSLGALLAIGCGSLSMPPPDSTITGRFEWSQDKFDSGDYHAAIRGFEDFLLRDPLNPLADSAKLMLGEAYLLTDQELLAANEFEQLATTRPNSPLADDAQYGACRAEWAISPKVGRDQESTARTMETCRELIEYFPRSKWVPAADSILGEARTKMAEAEYQIGLWYFKRGFYESANIYLQEVLATYPGAPIEPEVLATLYKSLRRVGFEREANDALEKLLTEYGDTPQAQELASPSSGPS
ncbi:MAG: outer membrane protein assembly factor BamD [Gemmatimonadales bacterium]